MPSWSDLPYEVQEMIVAEAVTNFDEVSTLHNIFLVSKDVHDSLVGAPERNVEVNEHIFQVLFESIFDSAAAVRRLGPSYQLTPNIYAATFKERCTLLNKIQARKLIINNNVDTGVLEAALWEVYFMLLDDDGKNMVQLERAGMQQFIKDLLLELVRVDRDEYGWIKETPYLQLAAACFSIMSDRASVLMESEDESNRIIDTLQSILLATHMYPYSHLPITMALPWDIQTYHDVPAGSLRSVANMPISEASHPIYFGHELEFVPPLLSPSIIAITVNRLEKRDIGFIPETPLNRAEALERDWQAPTRADWEELNLFRRMALGSEVPRAGGGRENLSLIPDAPMGSKRWDHTFSRMWAVGEYVEHSEKWVAGSTWFDTIYHPGMFSGRWLGRLFVPDWEFSQRILAMHPQSVETVLATFDDPPWQTMAYFQADLSEYHAVQEYVGYNAGQGIDNAYFPSGIDFPTSTNVKKSDDMITVTDPLEPQEQYSQKKYKLLQLPSSLPYPRPTLTARRCLPETRQMQENAVEEDMMEEDEEEEEEEEMDADDSTVTPEDVEMDFDEAGVGEGVPYLDILLTGEMDHLHSLAWGDHTYYGRVRKLDGLMVLVRVSKDVQNGRWVYSGYVHLANTIIGTWRQSGLAVEAVGLQGTFLISKVGPEVQIIDNSI
ncbi:hypothetical protein M422DRAFT_25426 [Sphaerobolus stellatus SS14]|nr:hypothetical protein M422DRAFT_25426 [Sphaerobolus stellatus SS14]